MVIPEPRLEPPEDPYIMANCGHEIYDGELCFDWDGKTICSECFKEKIDELTLEELADSFSVEYRRINFGGRR